MREKEGLSYGIQTWLAPSSFEENSQLNLYAIFAPQNRERVRTAIGEELARALKDGFTEAEVADAKRALLQARRIARAQDDVARERARAAGLPRPHVGLRAEDRRRHRRRDRSSG